MGCCREQPLDREGPLQELIECTTVPNRQCDQFISGDPFRKPTHKVGGVLFGNRRVTKAQWSAPPIKGPRDPLDLNGQPLIRAELPLSDLPVRRRGPARLELVPEDPDLGGGPGAVNLHVGYDEPRPGAPGLGRETASQTHNVRKHSYPVHWAGLSLRFERLGQIPATRSIWS